MQLKNKTMLITGASSGIGAATAKAAAREGARVLLLARTQAKLEKVAAEIQARGGEARVWPVDVSQPEQVRQVARQITDETGAPDIIFNNAGAGRWLFTEETEMGEAAEMMAVPYLAAFYVTQAFLPAMLRRNSGLILNMSSVAAYLPWPGATAYAAARWAMRGFTEALRADLHGTNVRAALIVFAKVQSDFWAHNPGSEERVPGAQAMIPVITTEQAAAAVVRGIKRDRRVIMTPFMLRVVLGMDALFPGPTRWLLNNTGAKRPLNQQKGSLGVDKA